MPEPARIHQLFSRLRPGRDGERLGELALLLATAPQPPGHEPHFARFPILQKNLRARLRGDDPEAAEEALLELYACVHMHEAPYTDTERAVLDAARGYWCHAGGLEPILRAADWLLPDSVSLDLGAGNGLQALLMQRIAPHARSVQVEISSRMVDIGRSLQRWLGVPDARVEWVVGDVLGFPVVGFDLVYLYRPVRPEGPGLDFYLRLAAMLEASPRPVVVLSVADCLGPHLSPRFERLSFDGHLACFRGPMTPRTGA